MATRSYEGFAYRQTPAPDAPWIVLTVIPAEELLAWAGIPRRTESATMGFQRVEDTARVLRAKEFFDLPPNQSPTALVVGVHPPIKGQKQAITLSLQGASHAGPVPCTLNVDFDPTSLTLQAAIQSVRSQLHQRLQLEKPPDEQAESDAAELEEIAADDAAEAGDEGADNGDQEIELAHSLLHRVLQNLSDAKWVSENSDTIMDLAKPATIIDGQHRVRGAALCERGIPFAVCVLVGCSWPEQVFQFTVVNYSARGIPDQFITANAALSLTQNELDALQTRLTQARVKVVEYELMRVVQFDPESPFFNMVNLSEGRDSTKIGYKTMVRVAKDWYLANHPVIKNTLLPALYPQLAGRSAGAKRLQAWKEEPWGKMFVDFWRVVRDAYQGTQTADGSSLWSVGSQLLVAIVLYELQRQFFIDLSGQDETYFEVPAGEDPVAFLRGKIRQRAMKFVTWYPPEFFTTTWHTSSLNISSGRKALETALTKMRESKGKYQYAKSALVTGETG